MDPPGPRGGGGMGKDTEEVGVRRKGGLYCLCGGRPGEQSGGAWKGRRGSERQGEVTKGPLTESKKEPVTHERLLSNSEVGNAPW